jgi:hypothetical protein
MPFRSISRERLHRIADQLGFHLAAHPANSARFLLIDKLTGEPVTRNGTDQLSQNDIELQLLH